MRCAIKANSIFVAATSLFLALGAWGAENRADCERDFAPRSGQAGKDVIWVPTQEDLVMAMLKAAKVTAKDYVVDLGSGDGRIPITAAKEFGARALGIEYNPQMVQLAQCYVRAEGVGDKVQIREGDIFETNFSDATVVTMYLLSDLNMRLRPTILKMKPGTRVVSNSFDMGDWRADEDVDVPDSYSRGYLWIVPAHVNGSWTFREESGSEQFELRIEQTFQDIEVAVSNPKAGSVRDAKLRGAEIEFSLVLENERARAFKGQVDGESIRVAARRGAKVVNYVGRRSS